MPECASLSLNAFQFFRSRPGYWVLAAGADKYIKPILTQNKYVFVGAILQIFVGNVIVVR